MPHYVVHLIVAHKHEPRKQKKIQNARKTSWKCWGAQAFDEDVDADEDDDDGE